MPTAGAPPRGSRPRSRPARRDQGLSFRERARLSLQADGHRLTQQRHVVLDVIERAPGHLDADGVYRLARERDPRISLSTVYRTLSLLKRHDLVDELRLNEEHAHYEVKTARPHYHLVCASCGRVEEFGGAVVERLAEQLHRERGFQLASVDLDIVGRCPHCAAAAA